IIFSFVTIREDLYHVPKTNRSSIKIEVLKCEVAPVELAGQDGNLVFIPQQVREAIFPGRVVQEPTLIVRPRTGARQILKRKSRHMKVRPLHPAHCATKPVIT